MSFNIQYTVTVTWSGRLVSTEEEVLVSTPVHKLVPLLCWRYKQSIVECTADCWDRWLWRSRSSRRWIDGHDACILFRLLHTSCDLDLELWPWPWCMTLTFSLVTLALIYDLSFNVCEQWSPMTLTLTFNYDLELERNGMLGGAASPLLWCCKQWP